MNKPSRSPAPRDAFPRSFFEDLPARQGRGNDLAPLPVVAGRGASSKRNRHKQLRLFCYTALMGSLTKAAERASVTQSSASQQVRALEQELQIELFERRGPRIALTAAGRQFYDLAMPLVEGMDNLYASFHEHFSHAISGEVRIVAEPSAGGFLLPRYLKRFSERYPRVRLSLETLYSKPALQALRAREVDFFVGTTRDMVGDDLQYRSIGDFEIGLATPEDHPLADHELVSADVVEDHPMIMPAAGTHTRYLWDLYAMRHDVKFNVLMEVSVAWVVKKLVQSGLGISVLSSLYVNEGDRVSLIPFAEPFPRLSYGLVTNRDTLLSAAARQFVMMVAPDDLAAGSDLPDGDWVAKSAV